MRRGAFCTVVDMYTIWKQLMKVSYPGAEVLLPVEEEGVKCTFSLCFIEYRRSFLVYVVADLSMFHLGVLKFSYRMN